MARKKKVPEITDEELDEILEDVVKDRLDAPKPDGATDLSVVPPGESAPEIIKALPGEDAVDEALVAHAVQQVNAIHRAKGLETARDVGTYLLKTFFSDDPAAFVAKGKKHASFRALADRDELAMSQSFLWYSVAVLDQLKQLPADIGAALPMSHHRLLLPVKDPTAKLELAKAAVAEGMAKRELEAKIKTSREHDASDGGRRGRPTLPGWAKAIGSIQRAIAAADDDVTADSVFVHRPEIAKTRLAEIEASIVLLNDLKVKLETAIAEDAERTRNSMEGQ